mgnify:CR=1 FL=1
MIDRAVSLLFVSLFVLALAGCESERDKLSSSPEGEEDLGESLEPSSNEPGTPKQITLPRIREPLVDGENGARIQLQRPAGGESEARHPPRRRGRR